MKIFKLISDAIKIYSCLTYLSRYRKDIEKARISGNIEEEKKNILLATSTWGKKLSEKGGMSIKLYGEENLPKEGPVVYMCNHQGYADIVALCAVLDKIQFGYVAKDNLAKVPLYGKWIDRIRSVLINRGNPREGLKAISSGVSLIKQGFSLLIFPEGTRSKSDEMVDFKPGAMKLATKPKVPIVPITLDGTWKIFERQGYIVPGEVKILIHKPIDTSGLNKEEERELNDRVYDIIKSGLNTLRKTTS